MKGFLYGCFLLGLLVWLIVSVNTYQEQLLSPPWMVYQIDGLDVTRMTNNLVSREGIVKDLVMFAVGLLAVTLSLVLPFATLVFLYAQALYLSIKTAVGL